MTLALDNPYASVEEKQRFLDEFGYRYIDDPLFRRTVDKKILEFERNRYVTYTDKNNYNNVGNPNYTKLTLEIGEIKMLGAYYSGTKIKYDDDYFEMKNGDMINFPYPKHYLVNVKVTHFDELIETNYTNNTQIFDTGNQVTILPCPKYWNRATGAK